MSGPVSGVDWEGLVESAKRLDAANKALPTAIAPCPKCGCGSRLSAIGGDCLACTMGWEVAR